MQINIIAPNQEGHGTALFENMRASGNIGDIIFIGADDGNLSDLVREGLILDMTDYMEDSENLLKYEKQINYVEIAKIKVKATLNCNNLNLDGYLLTPVIVFDFDHGISKLKERYPHNMIYSANLKKSLQVMQRVFRMSYKYKLYGGHISTSDIAIGIFIQ